MYITTSASYPPISLLAIRVCNLRLWEESYSFSSLTSSPLWVRHFFFVHQINDLFSRRPAEENSEWETEILCLSSNLDFHLLWAMCPSTIISVPTVSLVWILISCSGLYYHSQSQAWPDASLESKHSRALIIRGCTLCLFSGTGSNVSWRSCISSSSNSLYNFLWHKLCILVLFRREADQGPKPHKSAAVFRSLECGTWFGYRRNMRRLCVVKKCGTK